MGEEEELHVLAPGGEVEAVERDGEGVVLEAEEGEAGEAGEGVDGSAEAEALEHDA